MDSLVIVNALDGFFLALGVVGQVLAVFSAALIVGAQLFRAASVSAIGGIAWLVGVMLTMGAGFVEDWFPVLLAVASGAVASVLIVAIDVSRTVGERIRFRVDEEGAVHRQSEQQSARGDSV